MIKFVFNGYYRSGTTIFYLIISESNYNTIVLCEPLHPFLFNRINDPNKAYNLHGFYPFSGYHTEYFSIISQEYFLRLKSLKSKYSKYRYIKYTDIIPFQLNEILPLFDLLAKLEVDVIIQPNRCHFILKDIARYYNCSFIHIIRNPVDTWIAQTFEPVNNKIKIIKTSFINLMNLKQCKVTNLILTKFLPRLKIIGDIFYIGSDYKIISERFNLETDTKDWLDRMLVVWTYCNYYAFKQADDEKGMVVYYEEVTSEPERWLKIMSDFSGVNFDLRFAKILKPRITKDESLKKHFVERLERLGLLDMVNEFYPPKRWFGNS